MVVLAVITNADVVTIASSISCWLFLLCMPVLGAVTVVEAPSTARPTGSTIIPLAIPSASSSEPSFSV